MVVSKAPSRYRSQVSFKRHQTRRQPTNQSSPKVIVSRGKWSVEQVDDSREQLVLSSKLAGESAPDKKLVTRLLVLTKTKEPVIGEHLGEVRTDRVARTLVSVEQVWKAIASGVVSREPSLVGRASCGYRRACEASRGRRLLPTVSKTETGAGPYGRPSPGGGIGMKTNRIKPTPRS
jgi:hypothetical protein